MSLVQPKKIKEEEEENTKGSKGTKEVKRRDYEGVQTRGREVGERSYQKGEVVLHIWILGTSGKLYFMRLILSFIHFV